MPAAPVGRYSGRFMLTRRFAFFLLGAVTGFIWLLPVFGTPSAEASAEDGSSVLRYLRLMMPLTVFAFVRAETVFGLLQSWLLEIPHGRVRRSTLGILAAMLVLGALPLFSGLLTANTTFIVSAVLPLTLSLMTLLGMTLLEERLLKTWVLGVTAPACLFLVLGIVTSHLEASTYFGRPRLLLGFVHPVSTASAILAVMIFTALAAEMRWDKFTRRQRRLGLSIYGLVSLVLLLVAQSRNLLLSILVGLGCFGIAYRCRSGVRFGWFSLLLLLPLSLYAFILLGSPDDPVWAFVNQLSSGRLGFFQAVLTSNFDLSSGQGLFEAGNARLAALAEYAGFAATDSVFLSFLINYGVFSFLAFVGMLLWIGHRLSYTAQNAVPFGALCGVVLFFNLDAQGVTTSNLAVFIVFAYAVRAGILARSVRSAAAYSFLT